MRLRALPLLVAVALVAVGGTDVATASRLRADNRAAAQAAAQRRAVTHYRAALRPLAERIYEQTQPLQEAAEELDRPGPDSAQVMFDVFGRTGARARLVGLARQVHALPVPGRLTVQGEAVRAGADVLAETAKTLEDSARSTSNLDSPIGTTATAMTSAVLVWGKAVVEAYGDDQSPAVPGALSSRPRRPDSRGEYVLMADHVCSHAYDADLALPPIDEPKQFVVGAPRFAKLIRSTVTGLRAVPVPTADRARVAADIGNHLDGVAGIADGMEQVVAAIRKQDPAIAKRGLDTLIGSLKESQSAARGFNSYGATLCGDLLAVDPRDIPKNPGPTRPATKTT